jgi:trehalose 6-phosphate phosphatase
MKIINDSELGTMLHLFENGNIVEENTRNKKILLFLDYDGTLIPGKKAYREARLAVSTWKTLDNLSRLDDCKVCLVSDRSITDLRLLTDFKDVNYIGNHGMETQADAFAYHAGLNKDVRYSLRLVYNNIYEDLYGIPGIVIEDKRLSIGIHYRMVSAAHVTKIKAVVSRAMYEHTGHLDIEYRRNTIDIRPKGVWNKGWAAAMLLAKYPETHFPICVGHDSSNETLFKTFQHSGLTVRVGKSHDSAANFYLDNTGEVQQFLLNILELKRSKPSL